jgi:ADP-ribose pyrophosphatase YjhB (NUDIX family)
VLLQAVAVVVIHQGKTLLVRRARGRPAEGYWTPVTGKPEAGESLPDAARREVFEEVGLPVTVEGEVHRCEAVGAPYELVWFLARCAEDPGALRLARDEVSEARWCSWEEATMLEPMFEVTRDFYRESQLQQDEWVRCAP